MAHLTIGPDHSREPITVRTDRRRAALIALIFSIASLNACGAADDSSSAPSRAYELRLSAEDDGEQYGFVAEDPVDIRVGDEVTFQMRNAGELIHDLQVLDPGGTRLGAAAAVAAGGSLELTVAFTETGVHRLICDVDDHLIVYDMQAAIEVTAAD